MEASAEGMRALWISLAVLGATAVIQAAVVALSGSVALLGDTLHNAADALTAVPLGVAFIVGRRPADPPLHLRVRAGRGPGGRRDRRPDPGVLGAGRLRGGEPPRAPAARLRPDRGGGRGARRVRRQRAGRPLPDQGRPQDRLRRAGRRRAARAHGRLYLAGGAARRRRRGAGLEVGRPRRRPGDHRGDPRGPLPGRPRGLAAADGRGRPGPGRPGRGARCASTPGVLDVGSVRLRWVGHQLWAECEIAVDGEITAVAAHQVAVNAEHALLHALPRLSAALVHADPQARQGTDPHAVLAPAPLTAARLSGRIRSAVTLQQVQFGGQHGATRRSSHSRREVSYPRGPPPRRYVQRITLRPRAETARRARGWRKRGTGAAKPRLVLDNPCREHLPAARHRRHRPPLQRSPRPREAGGRADRGVRPRGRRRRQGRRPRLPWLVFLQGGPGFARAAAGRAVDVAGPGARTTTGCCCSTSGAPGGRRRSPRGRWRGSARRPPRRSTWRASAPTRSCLTAS